MRLNCYFYIGIPAGLFIGVLLSFVTVQVAVAKTVPLETGTEISFNPVIFVGAALFALSTTIIIAIKPARIASKILQFFLLSIP